MSWVRLDDHFDEHPKIAAAGPLALALFVTGLAYCNRNLTDGYIPNAVANRLCNWTVTDQEGNQATVAVTAGMAGYDVDSGMVIESLLDHGLWKRVKGGYRIHDYDHYQPSKEQVLAERKAARERMRKHRDSRGSPEQTQNFDRSSRKVRGKFKDPVPVPKDLPTEKALGTGTSPTTRDASAPPELAEAARSADAHNQDEEPEVKNGQPERPAYDVVRDLIRNGGHNYTDEDLLDEMDAQARRRNTPIPQPQRDELLELAAQLRKTTAAT